MTVPYVVGQWVRGERFYGRAAELETLRGERRTIWIAGTRRIGKTSLLRQLEHVDAADANASCFPLFWDLQGVEDGGELAFSFHDALLDAGDRLAALDIAVPDEHEDVTGAVARLAGTLAAQGHPLLLLGDEAEDLVALLGREPELCDRLLAMLAGGAAVRLVLASSVRLASLAAANPNTLRLLQTISPPVHLGALSAGEARALVRQDKLPEGTRPTFDGATVERICERCGGHPFLLQLLAKRVLELGDLATAVEAVAADPMTPYLFAADFALLGDGDRRLLEGLPAGASDGAEPERLARLAALGLVRPGPSGAMEAGNSFLAAWLEQRARS